MASGRMLQKRISNNDPLARVAAQLDAELGFGHGGYALAMFSWSIAHQDVEGRIKGDPRILRGEVIPMLEWITSAHVARYIQALGDARLLVWYEVSGKRYIWFPGFDGCQPGLRRDREAPSALPSPNGAKIIAGAFPVDAGVTPADIPADPGGTPSLKSESGSLKSESPASQEGGAFAPSTQQGSFNLAPVEQAMSKKTSAPDMAEAVTHFRRRWVEVRKPDDGEPPSLTKADRYQLVAMLTKYGLETWKRHLERFLVDDDRLVAKDGWPLRLMPQRIDGYRATAQPKAHVGHAKPAPHNEVTREVDL